MSLLVQYNEEYSKEFCKWLHTVLLQPPEKAYFKKERRIQKYLKGKKPFTMDENIRYKIEDIINERGQQIIGFTEIDGVVICIVKEKKQPIMKTQNIKPKNIEPPTITQMVSNFTTAMAEWAKSGFKVVAQEEFQRRITICRSCDAWDEEARGGLGKCKNVKCGCTKLKHWLESSKCPDNLW